MEGYPRRRVRAGIGPGSMGGEEFLARHPNGHVLATGKVVYGLGSAPVVFDSLELAHKARSEGKGSFYPMRFLSFLQAVGCNINKINTVVLVKEDGRRIQVFLSK